MHSNSDHPRSFSDRIKIVAERVGGFTELARRTSLSTSVLHKYVSDASDPSRKRLIAIAEAGGVSLEWLATGRGSPDAATPTSVEPAQFAEIPRYDVELSAGHGAFAERAQLLDHIPFTPEFLRRKLGRGSADGLVILEARGDSMEPTISDGDLVLVDTRQIKPADGLYAFALGDTVHIKRLRVFGGVEVLSDNADIYPPRRLDPAELEQLHVIGRVRWIGRVVGH